MEICTTTRRIPIPCRRMHRGVWAVLTGERCRGAHVSVIVVGQRRMIHLHTQFLNNSDPTDVITFAYTGDKFRPEGEIFVCLDEAVKQARNYGVSTREELCRLAIHGTLHLTGYDDRTAGLRRQMAKREDHYLKKISSTIL